MKRCPLCHVRPTSIGWCGACRSSYRARNLSHATVMEVAQFGADRAREGFREMKQGSKSIDTIVDEARTRKAENG